MVLSAPWSRETERIRILHSCNVLDTRDPELDLLVTEAARLTGAPIAMVSLVAETRQWIMAKHGIDLEQSARNISFCTYTIEHYEPFIIKDARVDDRFDDNPFVTGDPHIVFYGGWPLITPDGFALGSLCVIDRVPRELTQEQCDGMALLARQVVLSLELRRPGSRGGFESPISALIAKRAELEREMSARSQLARLLVHDLKNPLTAIAGNVMYVADAPNLDEDQRAALGDAVRATKRMQGLLLDVLDISRALMADGRMRIRRERLALHALVDELLGSGVSVADSATVRNMIPEDLRIDADRGLIGRIVCNLVDNAKRYAPVGTAITVDCQRVSASVELSVSDLGRGVADADKPRLFEPFVQLDDNTTGRGLGLVFCKLAAEAHGGSVRIENNVPRGARFVVKLPLLS